MLLVLFTVFMYKLFSYSNPAASRRRPPHRSRLPIICSSWASPATPGFLLLVPIEAEPPATTTSRIHLRAAPAPVAGEADDLGMEDDDPPTVPFSISSITSTAINLLLLLSRRLAPGRRQERLVERGGRGVVDAEAQEGAAQRHAVQPADLLTILWLGFGVGEWEEVQDAVCGVGAPQSLLSPFLSLVRVVSCRVVSVPAGRAPRIGTGARSRPRSAGSG